MEEFKPLNESLNELCDPCCNCESFPKLIESNDIKILKCSSKYCSNTVEDKDLVDCIRKWNIKQRELLGYEEEIIHMYDTEDGYIIKKKYDFDAEEED